MLTGAIRSCGCVPHQHKAKPLLPCTDLTMLNMVHHKLDLKCDVFFLCISASAACSICNGAQSWQILQCDVEHSQQSAFEQSTRDAGHGAAIRRSALSALARQRDQSCQQRSALPAEIGGTRPQSFPSLEAVAFLKEALQGTGI